MRSRRPGWSLAFAIELSSRLFPLLREDIAVAGFADRAELVDPKPLL
jgi:hypothetical protein